MNASYSRNRVSAKKDPWFWCAFLLVFASPGALGQTPAPSPDPYLEKRAEQDRLRYQIGDVQNAVVLLPGQTLQRDLGSTENHVYRIAVRAGQYLHLNVNQRGIDVRLKLIAPGRNEPLTVDAANGAWGPESTSLVIGNEGDLFLGVAPVKYAGPPGHYDISLIVHAAPESADSLRIEAEKALGEAQLVLRSQRSDDYKKARKMYEHARELWQKVGDPYWQAFALSAIANLYAAHHKTSEFLRANNEAMALYRLARDPAGEYRSLASLGRYYFEKKEYQRALTSFESAFKIAGLLGDKSMAFRTQQDIALAEWNLGQQRLAVDHYQQMLETARTLIRQGDDKLFAADQAGEFLKTPLSRRNLVKQVDHNLFATEQAGEFLKTLWSRRNLIKQVDDDLFATDQAIKFLNQALKSNVIEKDAALEASLYLDLGWVYSLTSSDCGLPLAAYQKAFAAAQKNPDEATRLASLGKLEATFRATADQCGRYESRAAIDAYLSLLQIIEAGNRPVEKADVLERLGTAYLDAGQEGKGIESLEKALVIWRAVGDQMREGGTLDRLGDSYDSSDQTGKAQTYWSEAANAKRLANDSEGEIAIRFKRARTYLASAKYDEAAQSYEQLLSIETKFYDQIQIVSLIDLGKAYLQLNRLVDATSRLELAVARAKLGNRSLLPFALNNLGELYRSSGRLREAIVSYQDAIKEAEPTLFSYSYRPDEAPDLIVGSGYDSIQRYVHPRELIDTNDAVFAYALEPDVKAPRLMLNINVIFNNLGLAYYSSGNYELAIKEYERALANREWDASLNEVISNNLALVYKTLAQYEKALPYYQQNLVDMQRAKNRVGVGLTLNNLAGLYEANGHHEEALKTLTQALDVMRELKDPRGEGVVLNNLGSVCLSLKRSKDALEHFTSALAIRRRIRDRLGEADTLSNIGSAYLLQKDYRQAIGFFEQALVIERETLDLPGSGTTLHNLMLAYQAQGDKVLAIFCGKQAVNIFQQLRANAGGLGRESQNSFLHSKEDSYRNLATLLINSGRLPEAEQVLALLKQEEFAPMTRRDGPRSIVGYSTAEAAAVNTLTQLGVLGREANELRTLKDNNKLNETDRQRLDLIENTLLPRAAADFRRALEAIEKEAPDTKIKTAEVKEAQAFIRYLKELGKKFGTGTVGLYTVISTEKGKVVKGWVILEAPAGDRGLKKAYEMDVTDLNDTVADFREVMKSDFYDPQPLGRKLYRMIFEKQQQDGSTLAADLQAYLQNEKTKTLMWSLDGVLRYVPMAALRDGEKYLVERYRNVVFTTASQAGLVHSTNREWRALALGVSGQYETFPALPKVPQELSAIVHDEQKRTNGILPGTIKWDDEFQEQVLLSNLSEGYNVLHIASHFSYQPAQPEKSFLLLGKGGHLEVRKMQDLTNLFGKMDLVTLSACDTAVGDGDGKDVEGFAYLTQQLGAMAVIASLWSVDDVGTQLLMPEFYRLHQSGLSKAEAFQRAQWALLNGTIKDEPAGTKRAHIVGEKSRDPFKPYIRNPAKPFAHPYYWAPFILIGNWK
ncbi:MAG: hypothetical protein JWM21_4201 [Acidobacteria bacterium]|nr:hypothetical protein [Acidobacteriota bacterium]